VDSAIRTAVLRKLATGALLIAIVPPAAVLFTRPQPTKSIVLKMSLEPVADNPMMSAAR
jgi:hypothetical protein